MHFEPAMWPIEMTSKEDKQIRVIIVACLEQ